jgi:hypothetical protein
MTKREALRDKRNGAADAIMKNFEESGLVPPTLLEN